MICAVCGMKLPTEIRTQIKVRVKMRSRVCVCFRRNKGRRSAERNGTMVEIVPIYVYIYCTVLPYCLPSTPHLSAFIHGINLYINCCHSMRLATFSTDWAALLTCLRSSVDCVNIAFVCFSHSLALNLSISLHHSLFLAPLLSLSHSQNR